MLAHGTSFTCKIDFKFRLDKGVQTKETTGTCAGLSSTSTGDRIDTFGRHTFSLNTTEGIELECEIGAAMLGSGSLSEEVLESSLSCKATQDTCLTIDGPSYPAKCISTFRYKGMEYHGCTDKDQPDGDTRLWCATAVGADLEFLPNMWGHCNEKCGYCGGSAINASSEKRLLYRPCGYDCLINPYKIMEGSDKEPLIPPSLVTNDQFSNWNILPKGQYRFIFGDPSIILDCKYTKFADSVFKDARTVVAKCGPNKQYRFTVKDLEGRDLDSEVKNTRFGCSACPVGFDYMVGFTDIPSFNDLGEYNDIQNEAQCNELCQERGCKSFIFSFNHKKCKLARKHFTKMEYSNYEDYNVCTKQPDCCSTLEIASTGDTQTYQGARLGTYLKTGDKHNNRDIYKQEGGSKILYYRGEEEYGWVVSSGLSSKGGLRSSFDFECPSDAIQWGYFYQDEIWITDDGVHLSCSTVCLLNKQMPRVRSGGKLCDCKVDLPYFDVRKYSTNPDDPRGSASLRWGIQSGGFEAEKKEKDANYCIKANTQAEYSTNSCKDEEKYLFNKYAAGVFVPERLTPPGTNPPVFSAFGDHYGGMITHFMDKNLNLGMGKKQDFYYHRFNANGDTFKLELPAIPNHASRNNRKNDLSLKDLMNKEEQYIDNFLRDCKTEQNVPIPEHFLKMCYSSTVGSWFKLCMTKENNRFTFSDYFSILKQQSTDQMVINNNYIDYEVQDAEIKLTIDTKRVGWTGELLEPAEIKRIMDIPGRNDKIKGRKCGLSRAQFAKGRGAFGDYTVDGLETGFVKGHMSNGLAEKHFILDQRSDFKNLEAARQLSKRRRYPEDMNPQINTVFVVSSSFTNEKTSPNPAYPLCKDFGCLLDYSKLNVYSDASEGFELLGFKGLPSVRTETIRRIYHKRAINSFCIMDRFVETYQCTRASTNNAGNFDCSTMMAHPTTLPNQPIQPKKEALCVAVIDDALDSIGHLYGAFCKAKKP